MSGSFSESTTVKSSDPDLDVSHLQANHEEADARLNLHCTHTHLNTVVVAAHDTDVLYDTNVCMYNNNSQPPYQSAITNRVLKKSMLLSSVACDRTTVFGTLSVSQVHCRCGFCIFT